MGRVTAICTTAWGELWTASSRGTIRVWRVEATAGASVSVSPARELRRQGGMRAHTHAVNFLVVPPCGQASPQPPVSSHNWQLCAQRSFFRLYMHRVQQKVFCISACVWSQNLSSPPASQ